MTSTIRTGDRPPSPKSSCLVQLGIKRTQYHAIPSNALAAATVEVFMPGLSEAAELSENRVHSIILESTETGE
jgi:hypothetical protein